MKDCVIMPFLSIKPSTLNGCEDSLTTCSSHVKKQAGEWFGKGVWRGKHC